MQTFLIQKFEIGRIVMGLKGKFLDDLLHIFALLGAFFVEVGVSKILYIFSL